MRRLLSITVLSLFMNIAAAQNADIWGRLVYEDGYGVAGALVTIEDYYTHDIYYDTTDVNGYYSIRSTSSYLSDNSSSTSATFNSFITNSVGRSCNFYFFDSKQIDKATVYNILGQKVTTIQLKHKIYDTYKMWSNYGFWDGNSSSGFPVANGTYFISVKTTRGIQTLRFIHNGHGQFTTPIPISRIDIERYMDNTFFAEAYIPGKTYPDMEENLSYYMIKYDQLFDSDKFLEVDPIPEVLFNNGVNQKVHTVKYSIQDSTKILFIGNSYTQNNNGINYHLSQLFSSKYPDLAVDIQRRSYGGWSLEDHWYSSDTQEMLNGTPWDIVVLQEFSMNPVNSPDETLRYAQLFNDSIEEVGAETAFYMTWNREYDPEMIMPISGLYRSLGISMNAPVAPVGLAWQYALEEDPGLDLYTSDNSHPTIYGTYLAACVFYSTLFHQSPEGIEYGSELMDRSMRLFLQQIAWETVLEYNQH